MKIINDVNNYILKKDETIQSVLNNLITSNSIENNHEKELFLSQHYNDLLKLPDFLQKLDISSHMRILKNALNSNNQNTFNYHDFINFVIQMVEKPGGNKYSTLLSLFNIFDFDINDVDRLLKCKNFDESFIKNKIKDFISLIKENQEKTQQLEIKNDQLQSQVNKLTKIVKEMYKNCSFTPEYMKTIKCLVPVNQEWVTNGPTEATLTSGSTTIKVKSSSTYENKMVVNPCYLFSHGGWDCWGADINQYENSYILIEFNSPVVANFLTITSRTEIFNETPQLIHVFAKNSDSDFVLLAIFDRILCCDHQIQFFRFDNSSSYSSYKIMFNMPYFKAYNISLDKLNIGKIPNPFL